MRRDGILPPDGLRWFNIGPYPDHVLRIAKDGRGGLHIMQYHDGFGVETNLHLSIDELRRLIPYIAVVLGLDKLANWLQKRFSPPRSYENERCDDYDDVD
jgi:hypothetical protein